MLNVDEIQRIFFEAMKKGWAAGGKKIAMPELPGYKAIVWEDGLWRVVDCYAVGPKLRNGTKSVGGTTVFYDGAPVWVMSYGGYYDEEAILFLKRALLAAYQAHEFFGCRGPTIFTVGSMVYLNHARGEFRGFSGREEVIRLDDRYIAGWHEYSGLALI